MGVKLAAAAGYDPRALERCLDRLTKTVELFLGEKEKHSYFSDHPATADRMEAIEKTASGAQRASIPPILPSREAFLRLLDGLAAEEKGKGQIVVGLVEGADPEQAALGTLGLIQKESRKTPTEARRVDVNGHPGFYALYVEKKTNLHLLWVAMAGKMFRMAGVGEDQWKEALRKSALSLRPLRPEERAKVRVLRLRIETARAGESLNAFCERTANAFKPELTAVLNGVDGKPLAQGQSLKIGRWEAYRAGTP